MVRNSDSMMGDHYVELPEAFTQGSLGTVERLIDTAVAGNPELLTIDLSRVNAVDSAALNWLLATQTRLAGLGIQVLINSPSPLATDVFIATRMENRFQIVCSTRRPEVLGG
jgi:anti-anti-sigma regulatory factor